MAGSLPFFLFLKMKNELKDRHFVAVEDIQCQSRMVLDTLEEGDFQRAFQGPVPHSIGQPTNGNSYQVLGLG